MVGPESPVDEGAVQQADAADERRLEASGSIVRPSPLIRSVRRTEIEGARAMLKGALVIIGMVLVAAPEVVATGEATRPSDRDRESVGEDAL